MSALGPSWATSALCLAATAGIYLGAFRLHHRLGRAPWANPTALAIAGLSPLLGMVHVPYATYFAGAGLIHFLLGPATVALGVALYAQRERVRALALPGVIALGVGSLTGILSAVLFARLFGADRALVATVAPKSATTPIAMGIAESLGGEPSLTAVVVILTGIVGAVLARPLMTLLGVKDRAARGFALGVACHGLGTAAAFEEGSEAGTLAGLAMGLNGFLTALLVPLVLRLM
jgi:predicted murein hydrolase (TIGR00659 family)